MSQDAGNQNGFIANGVSARNEDPRQQALDRVANKLAPAVAITSQHFRPGDTQNAVKTGSPFPAAQLSNPNAANAGARLSGKSAPIDISPRDVYKQQQQMPIDALPPQVKSQHQQQSQQYPPQPPQQQQQQSQQSPPHPTDAAPPPPSSDSTSNAQDKARSSNEQPQTPGQDPSALKTPPKKTSITEDVCILPVFFILLYFTLFSFNKNYIWPHMIVISRYNFFFLSLSS